MEFTQLQLERLQQWEDTKANLAQILGLSVALLSEDAAIGDREVPGSRQIGSGEYRSFFIPHPDHPDRKMPIMFRQNTTIGQMLVQALGSKPSCEIYKPVVQGAGSTATE